MDAGIRINDLSHNQRALFASYVQQAADMGLSHICDDLREGDFEGWSDNEKQQLCSIYNEWNGVSEDDEDQRKDAVDQIGASALVSIAAWLLSPENEAVK